MKSSRLKHGIEKRSSRALSPAMTLIELPVIVLIMAVLVLMLIPLAVAPREEGHKNSCSENMRMIGRAVFAYTQNNVEIFPFSYGPADAEASRKKDAMTSIAKLYPEYIASPRCFRCPSTEGSARVRTNVPHPITDRNDDGEVNNRDVLPGEAYVWSNRNYTLVNSSYGYDCRIYPAAVSSHAIAADMDGSQNPKNGKEATANHRDGHHVLYVDGAVRWQRNNYCSNDAKDNIFVENAWHADTDSFISDNTPPGSDDTPGAFDDLRVSHDGYPDLHIDESRLLQD